MAEHVTRTQAGDPDRRLRDLLRTVRANAVLTAVVGVGLVALAVFVVSRESPTYRASSQVLVPVTPAAVTAEPSGTRRVVTLDTEAHRAVSDITMADLARATGTTDPRDSVRVSALPVTRVLVLEYTDTDPGRANVGVRAWTQSYLREQAAFVRRTSEDVLESLDAVPIDQAAARGTALALQESLPAWRSTVDAQLGRELRLRELAEGRASIVRQGAARPERKPWEAWTVGALMLSVLMGVGVALRRASRSEAAHQ